MTRISGDAPICAYVAVLSIALVAGAAGCGGGSSGSRSHTRSGTISGRAVQNGMDGATIEAFAVIISDGSNGKLLGTATTDSDGNYSLELKPAPSGAVRVTASGGTFISEANGATISTPSTISALLASASSDQTVNLNPLTDFVNSQALGAIKQSGTSFGTALSHANASVEAVFGLTSDPTTLTPDYTAAGIGTDAGNLGLVLGAIINEDQLLCPSAPGGLSAALSADLADGIFDGLDFSDPITYCGGDLAAIAGTSELEDAMSGLQQFNTQITSAFSYGGSGNVLTANGVAASQLLAPIAVVNQALDNAAPATVNTFLTTGTATMNTARRSATATLLPNGKVLIAGGADITGDAFASTELYDPASNSFATSGTAIMNVARYRATATLLSNGKVLIAGGEDSNGAALGSTELYDPIANSFAASGTPTMNIARDTATATLLPNGKVLIAGGFGATGDLASTELYDPASNSFATSGTPTMSSNRYGATATLLPNGLVLIAGGTDISGPVTSTDLYDPATNTFAATGTATMNVARYYATATLLPNNKVLIAGGYGDSGVLNSTELYDTASNSFATSGTASMNAARNFYQTATLLPNGDVLIAGGEGANGDLSSTELYTPSSNSFATSGTAAMNVARDSATATLLPTGQVLIAGGANSTALASTELYTP